MGRRKERRLAAISAAGRRMKLDLFAEPSGEVAGAKPLSDVAGGDFDPEKCADVPISPSSSDQKQGNPLLLLGQYSDDEFDDSIKRHDDISDSALLVDVDSKVDCLAGNEVSKFDSHAHTMDNAQSEADELEVENKLDGSAIEGYEVAPGSFTELHSSSEHPLTEESGMQIVEDLSSDWKIVMHDESKRYYYWNTRTGETSWDVPDNLSVVGRMLTETIQIPDLRTESNDFKADGLDFVSGDVNECSTTVVAGNDSFEILNVVYDASQDHAEHDTCKVDANHGLITGSLDCSSEHLAVSSELDVHQTSVSHIGKDTNESGEVIYVLAAELIKKCEIALEKLKAIGGPSHDGASQTWAYRYIIEVETRLSDCKTLLPFGSSIIPFWRNTEEQLGRIGTAMEVLASGNTKFEFPGEVRGVASSSMRSNVLISENGGDSAFTAVKASTPEIQEEKLLLNVDQCPVERDICRSESPQATLGVGQKDATCPVLEQSVTLHTAAADFDAHEEVDMDVEMEVDDDTPTALDGVHELVGTGQSRSQFGHLQTGFLSEVPPIPADEFNAPPPPDEEWIPPPPPEGDPFPPPPTEEAPLFPIIVYPETGHQVPYPENYDGGYSAPSFQYYASADTEVQSSGYHTHIDGSHVGPTQQSHYFLAVAPGPYLNAPVVTSVEPVVLYDTSNGVVHPGSADGSFENAVVYTEPCFSNPVDSYVSGCLESVELVRKVDEKMELLSQKVDSEFANSLVGEERVDTGVAATVSATTTGGTSTNGNNIDMALTTVKNPSKARPKKRVAAVAVAVAPTLRSNKKVSSLVDKWKAAKEELHGDEDDEPGDAYEFLERKKKKEIDEWHAHQLASGEAHDNANFVPLRGDWRDRVKRKKRTEFDVQSKGPVEQVGKEKRQPDLVELAKGLPPGWQAYWDESSKEVYYGNLKTSETTWTRPSC